MGPNEIRPAPERSGEARFSVKHQREHYDPLPDLAAVLAGLQVARSIGGGYALGAACEPFDRLRRELHIFGWRGAPEHELMLRAALAALPAEERTP